PCHKPPRPWPPEKRRTSTSPHPPAPPPAAGHRQELRQSASLTWHFPARPKRGLSAAGRALAKRISESAAGFGGPMPHRSASPVADKQQVPSAEDTFKGLRQFAMADGPGVLQPFGSVPPVPHQAGDESVALQARAIKLHARVT